MCIKRFFKLTLLLMSLTTSTYANNLSVNPDDPDYREIRLKFNECKSILFVALGKRLEELVVADPKTDKQWYRQLDKEFFKVERMLKALELEVLSQPEVIELKKLDWPSFQMGFVRGMYANTNIGAITDAISDCERFLHNLYD